MVVISGCAVLLPLNDRLVGARRVESHKVVEMLRKRSLLLLFELLK
jgi:hypothetical protein